MGKKETARLRKIIKTSFPKISVRMGTGREGRGWVDIRGSKDRFGRFKKSEKKFLASIGIKTGLGGGTELSPKEVVNILKKHGNPKPRKWIKKMDLKVGALSRQLKIPLEKNIPMTLLEKIKGAKVGSKITNPTKTGKKRISVTELLKKRVSTAITLKKIRKK